MAFGIRFKGPVVGFILSTAILGYAAQRLVPSIVDPRAGLPDKSTLLSIAGVPSIVSPERDYFTLPGGTAYFHYPFDCGRAEETYEDLRREQGPITILYGREIHKSFQSGYAYRDVFEIEGEHVTRTYTQCERIWAHRSRMRRDMSIPFLALLTLVWLRSVWRLATKRSPGAAGA